MMDRPTPADFQAALQRTLRLSQYVARIAHARPEVVAELESRGARAFTREEMRASLEDGEGRPPMAARLRSLRARVMVTLAHRDLNGLASLDEVFGTMSALADECIAAAAREAHAATARELGHPQGDARLIVAALGKLGGEELNVSSDVDLVFLYEDEGETDRARPV